MPIIDEDEYIEEPAVAVDPQHNLAVETIRQPAELYSLYPKSSEFSSLEQFNYYYHLAQETKLAASQGPVWIENLEKKIQSSNILLSNDLIKKAKILGLSGEIELGVGYRAHTPAKVSSIAHQLGLTPAEQAIAEQEGLIKYIAKSSEDKWNVNNLITYVNEAAISEEAYKDIVKKGIKERFKNEISLGAYKREVEREKLSKPAYFAEFNLSEDELISLGKKLLIESQRSGFNETFKFIESQLQIPASLLMKDPDVIVMLDNEFLKILEKHRNTHDIGYYDNEFKEFLQLKKELPSSYHTKNSEIQNVFKARIARDFSSASFEEAIALARVVAGDKNKLTDEEYKQLLPDKEFIDTTFRNIFENYVKKDERVYSANSGDYLNKLKEYAELVGGKVEFSDDYIQSVYEYCLLAQPPKAFYIDEIKKFTGIDINKEVIIKNIFENRVFESSVPFSISSEMLEQYFSDLDNTSAIEYKRIYLIFKPYEYYQKVLANIESQNSIEAKRKVVYILGAMGISETENEEHYAQIKSKIKSYEKEGNKLLNQSISYALAEFISNGDNEELYALSEIIKKRAKGSDNSNKHITFTVEQEIALKAIMEVDKLASNDALLSLLFTSDINPRIKHIIASNLLRKKDFLTDGLHRWLGDNINSGNKEIKYDDLRYFQAIQRIPSADLRQKSLGQVDEAFLRFSEDGVSVSDFHQETCPAIPENIFLQLCNFTYGDKNLLNKFNDLYQIAKGSIQQEALLFGIVNSSVSLEVQAELIFKLKNLDFVTKEGPVQLTNILKTVAFLDTVEYQLGKQENSKLLEILHKDVMSIEELNKLLNTTLVQEIRSILPNDKIDANKIEALWESWGSLEPLFIYASKMAESGYDGALDLIAEVVANIDPPYNNRWKEWRYNIQNKIVYDQVGNLSPEQMSIWKIDHFAELGDIMIATSSTDRPKQISQQFESALNDKHIYNPDIDTSNKYKYIQDKLAATYELLSKNPENRNRIISAEVELLLHDINTFDSITKFSNIPRLQQAVGSFESGQPILINKKAKDTFAFITPFLTKEQNSQLQAAYKSAEDNGLMSIPINELVPFNMGSVLRAKINEIQNSYDIAIDSDIFERYEINKSSVKNVGQFYQKRQELKTLVDLYRLNKLTNKLIATDKIEEKTDKNGESISQVIENLRKYFKDSPTFLQDIENINSTITQNLEIGSNRRLAMLVTDNPQMLLQVGKYPIGCGSCQNYEGSPNWNNALAAYVADAHTKAMFLIDLNKLPASTRQEIEINGFDSIKQSIPAQNLLEATVARAITKIVKDNKQSTLFLEPTYSSINKGDLSMNKFFDIFAELKITDPMGIRLARGGGTDKVRVPASRNPTGQYEDAAAGDAGNAGMGIQRGTYTMPAKFINKFTPVSEEDRRLTQSLSRF